MTIQTADSSGPPTRVIFFDNLRFLLVAGVVLQHAGMAYSWSDWWPVADNNSSLFVAALVGFCDGFLMPSLFFISGYFAIPSIKKRSIGAFIRGKFKRLGIPWLVCTLFIGPVLPLIYHYTRNGLHLVKSYRGIWMSLMGNALNLDIGILPPMKEVMQNDLFYQRYMWFISLLITFFLIFAIVYHFRPGWFDVVSHHPDRHPGMVSTLKLFLTVGLLTTIGSTLLIGLMFSVASGVSNPESWFTLGNIIQFRVSRIFLHMVYFSIGILAFKYRWVQRGRYPGQRNMWTVLFLLSFVAYFTLMFLMKTVSVEMTKILGLFFWIALNFFTISALGLSSSLAYRYWNQETALNRDLAANSYNLYLTHYAFVLVSQLLLLRFYQVPVLLKYLLVVVTALCGGYATSRFLVKPRPGLTVILMSIVFITMFVVIHP